MINCFTVIFKHYIHVDVCALTARLMKCLKPTCTIQEINIVKYTDVISMAIGYWQYIQSLWNLVF